MLTHADYPVQVVEDIARLRRRISVSGIPNKRIDENLVIGSWNIRALGRFHPEFTENDGSPKRNLRALASIAEILRRFDVVAIQEIKRNTEAVRALVDDFLGPDWDLILTDVSAGSAGNKERLGFIFDRRRVKLSGLAGEIVLPETDAGDPAEQFDRTPYIVGFDARDMRFSLVTAHIKFGEIPDARIPELEKLAKVVAKELRDRARQNDREIGSVIVLGDFNIDRRGDNPLFQAFVSTGLVVPSQLHGLKTTTGNEPKFYDQIAWFMGDDMKITFNNAAGVIDFVGALFPELSRSSMTHRVSDHFPLWAEFLIDRSVQQMAETLGADPDAPDPLGIVPD